MGSPTVVEVIISGTTTTVVDARIDGVTTVAGAAPVTNVSGQIPDLGVNTDILATQGDILSLTNDVANLRLNLIVTGTALTDEIGVLSGNLISSGNDLEFQISTLSGDLIASGNNLDSLRDILSGNLISTGASLKASITGITGDIDTLTNNLVSTGNNLENQILNSGSITADISGNLITTGETLTSNLISSGNSLDTERGVLSGNLITTGQTLYNLHTGLNRDVVDNKNNLIDSGNNLEPRIVSNLGAITSLKTETGILSSATGELQEYKFNKAGGTISGSILPSSSGTLNLGSESLPFKGGFFNDLTVSSNTLFIGDIPISTVDGGVDFSSATGTTIFEDVSIRNLTVTGTETIIDVDNLAIKDNKIILNSGESGAGISLVTGGIIIDRGTLTDADLLFNEANDRFEFNFPLALDGNLAVTANQTGAYADVSNLIQTGVTLQSQITSNDGDITSLTAATGELKNQVNTTDTNLITTGQALTDEIAIVSGIAGGSTFDELSGNLVTTGQTLTSEITIVSGIAEAHTDISELSGNLITTGQTLQTQITSNDSDISALTSNLIVTGSRIDTVSGNLITTGQTLQTQITSNDTDITNLTSNLAITGTTMTNLLIETGFAILDTSGNADTTSSNLITTGQTLTSEISIVSGIAVAHTDVSALSGKVDEISGDLITTGSYIDSVSGNLISTGSNLQTQITSNDGQIAGIIGDLVNTGTTLTNNINTVSSNLVTTGSIVDNVSGNLITTGQHLTNEIVIVSGIAGGQDFNTLSGNLITTGQTLTTNLISTGNFLDAEIAIVSGLTTGSSSDPDLSGKVDTLSGNLITTGQTLQTQITSNDTDISNLTSNLITTGQTLTSEIAIVSGIATGGSAEDFAALSGDLITTGQTLQTQITSNDSDISTLTSNLITTGQTLTTDINTVSTNLISTGAVVDDISGNLITTGQTLQTQITSNDSDISTLTSNLISTGSVVDDVSGNLITTGQTLTTSINTNSSNLIATGQTLTSEIAIVSGIAEAHTDVSALSGKVDDISGNLITTGQTLTTNINAVSTNLITSGQTLQTQITSNDSDISTLTTNLVTTGQTLTTDINTVASNLVSTGSVVDDISGNLITTGQTLQTQITSNDGDITNLTSNLITTGQTLTSEIGTVSGLITDNDAEITALLAATGELKTDTNTNASNLVTTGQTLTSEIAIVSGIAEAHTDISELSGNLITTGQTLTTNINTVSSNLVSTGSIVDDISGNLITTGQTLQTQITSNDGDITNLTSNLITTGQTLTTEITTVSGLITDNDGDITALKAATGVLKTSTDNNTANLISTGAIVDDISGNLITSGQTLQTQITSNDSDISTLTSNVITTGQTLQTQITSNDGDITNLTSNLITTGQTLTTDINTVSSNLVTTGQTLQTQITSNDSDISTLTSNLVATGSVIDDISGNLITTGQTLQTQITSNDSDISTLTSNLVTTGQTLTTNVNTVASNLVSTGTVVDDISGNLITTGQTLQTQITSNDTDITNLTSNLVTTGQTLTTDINTVSSNLVSTGSVVDDISGNLITTGQTLQTQITSNDGDITSLTSNLITTGQTLQTQITSNDSDIATLDSTTVKITTNQSVAGNKIFTDTVTINNLTVTGTEVIVDVENLAVRDNIIHINSGESGAGISRISGGITIDRGTEPSANILYNDANDRFELNFPLATEGNVVASAANLITTGQTLTTNINTVSTNLVSTGSVVDDISGNLITTGQTLQTQITSNDGDISTLTSNLVTTGQTLTTNINTVSSNLVSTGAIVDDISGNLITTGQTLQTQITSNDTDITNLSSNLVTTGQTLTTSINTVANNLVTTGQTLTSEIATVSGLIPATVIDGGGTANKVPLWSDANTIGDSVISQSSSKIGIGTATPATDLHIRSADPVIRLEDSSPNGVYGSIDGAGGSLILSADQGVGAASSNIQLKVDNAEAMRVIAGGSVGIGTPTPTARLTTVTSGNEIGNLITGTVTTESALHVEVNYLTTGRAGYFYSSAAGTQTRELVSIINDNALSTGTTALKITQDSTGPALVTLGGKVGIGIAAPAANFQLHSTDNEVWQYITTDAANKDVGIYMGLDYDGTANYIGIVFDQSDDALKLFNSNSIANHLVIKNDGNVGIGTSAPSADLEVSTASGGEFLVTRSGNSGVTLQQVNGGDATSGSLSIKGGTSMNLFTGGVNRLLIDATGNVSLPADGASLKLGASADLQMWHGSDGHSYISNTTGAFWIKSTVTDGNIIFAADRGDGGGTFDYFSLDGGSATYSGGTTAAYTKWQDNSRIALGTGKDLQLYHDGTDSFIKDAGQGNLKLLTDEFRLRNAADSAHMLTSSQGGAVTIYHNGAQKLITTSTGVTVTGALKTTTILDTNDSAGTSGQILTSTGSALDWKTLGEISGVDGSGTANKVPLWSDANTIGDSVISQSSSKIGIGTATPRRTLHVHQEAASSTYLQVTNSSTGSGSDGQGFQFGVGGDGTANIVQRENLALTFLTNNVERIRILAGGSVGIGTTAPASLLHLKSTGDARIIINADSDNSGEGDNPSIEMMQDGSVSHFKLGVEGIAGTEFTGSIANTPYLDSTNTGGPYGLQFATNNAARMIIAGDGKVGIGTATPIAKLHVSNAGAEGFEVNPSGGTVYLTGYNRSGGAYAPVALTGSSGGTLTLGSGGASFNTNVGIGTDAPEAGLHLNFSNDVASIILENDANAVKWKIIPAIPGVANSGLSFYDVTNTAVRMHLDNAGKVGIGTAAPARKLHVLGGAVGIQARLTAASGWGTGLEFYDGDTSGRYWRIGTSNNVAGDFSFISGTSTGAAPTATRVTILADGNVGIGTTAPGQQLSVGNAGAQTQIYTNGSGHSVLLNNTANKDFNYAVTGTGGHWFATSGANRLSIGSDGTLNLISAKFKINGSAGSSGQTLTTDGSGNISWSSAGSGTISGSGTDNYIPRFNGTTAIENSNITDDGTTIKFGVASNDASYIPVAVPNTFNSGWNNTSDSHATWINFYGYLGSTSKFRDFKIGNGKATAIATFDGSSGKVGIGQASPSQLLHLGDGADAARGIMAIEGAGGQHLVFSEASTYGQANAFAIRPASGTDFVIQEDGSSTAAFTINTSGNVGIGTTAPARLLHLYNGGSTDDTAIRIQTSDKTSQIGYFGLSNKLGVDFAGAAIQFRAVSNSYATAMIMQSDGNIGIGTVTPAQILHVAGGNLSTIRNNMFGVTSNTPGTGGETNIYHNAYYDTVNSREEYLVADEACGIKFINGRIDFRTAAAGSADGAITWINAVSILADGRVGIGTVTPDAHVNLHVAGAAYAFLALEATDAGGRQYELFSYATDQSFHLFDRTASAYRFTVDETGNFGIGTTAPNAYSNKKTLEINATWGGVIENSVSGTVKSRWDWSTGGITQFGTYVNEPLHLITNSSMAVTILGDGNVGIGTTAPGAKLEIDAGGTTDILLGVISNSTTYNAISLNGSMVDAGKLGLAGGGSGNPNLYVDVPSTGQHVFRVATSQKVVFDASGNVGIGIAAPNKKLTVVGGSIALVGGTAQGNFFMPLSTGNGDGGFMFSSDPNNTVQNYGTGVVGSMFFKSGDGFHVSATGAYSLTDFAIKTNGSVGIGTNYPGAKLHIESGTFPQVRINNQSSSGESGIRFKSHTDNSNTLHADIFIDASSGAEVGRMGFRVPWNGAERLTILHDGKVGIGTASPAWDLTLYKSGGTLGVVGAGSPRIDVMNTAGSKGLRIQKSADAYSTLTNYDGGAGASLTLQGASAGGNVGIGTATPGSKFHVEASTDGDKLSLENTSTGGRAFWTWVAGASYGVTQQMYDNTNTLKVFIRSYGDSYFNGGNVGIGSASPAAPLDVARASDYKVIKLGDDITSHYVLTGNADHTLTLTCPSYFQAEIVITAHQTNGGDYNNLYIRGIWSNNDTSHHWDEIENVGSLTNSTFTITNGQNGATTNSGEWKIVHDYVSGTFVKFTVRITDFYGTHAYTIS